MNGIDAAVASLLTSRVDSLLNIAPGSAATAQTGAADVGTAPTGTAAPAAQAAPPSAQTALSAVALTLDAIARSGGDATPAILGQTPLWPVPPALEIDAGDALLFGQNGPFATAASAAAATSSSSPSSAAPSANAASAATATANVGAAQVPVAALAAALEQTVGGSGLFYEAHLAQWLAGQRSPAELAAEPQNALLADSAASSFASSSGPERGRAGAGVGAGINGTPDDAPAARAQPTITTAQAARLAAGEVLASSVADLTGEVAHPGIHSPFAAGADSDAGTQQTSQTMAAAVHPATMPLVRQQLDLLATGQFRWSGEAWPGARLDWTIEQDGDEWDRSGGGAASEEGHPWRTRLTLSLPTLGTVDADLTLTGSRLAVRVLASPGGAARLAMQGESFRLGLAAAGIELNGLSIREIGGGAPAGAAGLAGGVDAQTAASAYARSAAVDPGAAADQGPAASDPTAAPGADDVRSWAAVEAAARRAARTTGSTGTTGTTGAAGGSASPRAADAFDWDL